MIIKSYLLCLALIILCLMNSYFIDDDTFWLSAYGAIMGWWWITAFSMILFVNIKNLELKSK